ncbi:LysR family transcriptional regulator [Zhihengliuella halotolerans]|uniref:LysR family transcriptional regulator n=1 Tax=Zhihengliuella halotolerans TaxID=370736 RepID=UPI000C810733|nr:LysR family transcriptional regulator [Zhihengliuella halotolerans]
MELQQLRYVLAVAETRNFTRAAERCFVVQSALSHQIKALEGELGLQLFARTSRRVELTEAGAAFLPAARAALEAAERAVAEASAATGRLRGTLRIGAIPTVTALDLPAALGAFRDAHPEVRISLRGGGSDEFMEQIAAGTLDVAVLGLSESVYPNRVDSRVLARERLVAVLPAGHRLAARRRLHLRDLAEEAFVDFPAGAPGRVPSDAAFAKAGVAREVVFEAAGVELFLGLVRERLAIALLSDAVVGDRSGLVTIPVADGPLRVQHLAWSEFNPSPAALAFVDVARGHALAETVS